MIELKLHRTIRSLKKQWKKLEIGVSPFQTYDMNKAVWNHRLFFLLREKLIFVYAEVIDNGNTKLIAPLAYRKGKNTKERKYIALSEINGLRNYDFVYSHMASTQELDYYTSFLINSIDCELDLNWVCEESPILRYAGKHTETATVEKLEQGAICFGSSYDKYFSGLSKNAKQNIRTAYNRLIADGKRYDFHVFYREPIPKEIVRSMMNVYCRRRSEKYNNMSLLHSVYLKYLDWQTHLYANSLFSFTACLKINGSIAAFLSGYVDAKQRIVSVPRLAIDSDHGRYSPGIVLMNETAKYFAEHETLQKLDLYGFEAAYKRQMGAELYYKYRIGIKRA